MIALRQSKLAYKLLMIFFLIIGGWLALTKNSYATSPIFIGFIIEASQMEGTMQSLDMTTGDTALAQNVPMLDLKFKDATVKGLIIKKLMQTPDGIVTTNMTSQDTVLFNNLELKVTNASFEGTYIPEQGNIGFKNVKLLAHFVTTDSSDLPKFKVNFTTGGQIEMEPRSEAELIQMKTGLEQLLIQYREAMHIMHRFSIFILLTTLNKFKK